MQQEKFRSTLSGTYTGPNGAGSFALQAAVTGAVNVYCGTYKNNVAGKGSGTWNLVQGADNALSGSYTEATGGSCVGESHWTPVGGLIPMRLGSFGSSMVRYACFRIRCRSYDCTVPPFHCRSKSELATYKTLPPRDMASPTGK